MIYIAYECCGRDHMADDCNYGHAICYWWILIGVSETMPMNRSNYPANWDEIATDIKTQAGWRCEQCGLQCRFPGDKFDTHKRTLTVAHINHVEMDCRPENLVALCPRCHLAYDQTRKVMQRLAHKRIESNAKRTLF